MTNLVINQICTNVHNICINAVFVLFFSAALAAPYLESVICTILVTVMSSPFLVILLAFGGPFYISGSLFSVYWLNSHTGPYFIQIWAPISALGGPFKFLTRALFLNGSPFGGLGPLGDLIQFLGPFKVPFKVPFSSF